MSISFALDSFKILYLAVSVFAWLMMGLFSPRYMAHYENKKRFLVFTLITFLSTLGVFFAGDLCTLFLFFEMMSLASYVWVSQDEKPESLRAGDTYMAVAVIGGLVLFLGIVLLYSQTKTLELSALKEAFMESGMSQTKKAFISGLLIFGFGAKAGAFPLHIWLPKAHPVAPAPASALLSGILTKTGVYGIILVSYSLSFGIEKGLGFTLLIISLLTMVTGAILAVFSTNLKRTLASSSVSQIGFILTGVSVYILSLGEGSLALSGSALHMVNHSLIKLVLFFIAGVIYQNLHELELDKLRGYGKNKPFLMVTFLLGLLGIGGIPFFNGYASKTMIHEGLIEIKSLSPVFIGISEWIFLISGGLTLAYMLKIFVCIFIEENKDLSLMEKYKKKDNYMSTGQKISIIIPAALIPIIGFFPGKLGLNLADRAVSVYKTLSFSEEISFFSFESLKGALISILIGILLYFLIIRADEKKHGYRNLWPQRLDIENEIYRPFLLKLLPGFFGFIFSILDKPVDFLGDFLSKTVYKPKVQSDKGRKMIKKGFIFMQEKENIIRTLSFGLMLACIGMFIILLYLMYSVFSTL